MSKRSSRILQGAREALAFAHGKADASTFRVHVPAKVNVRAIRRKLGLSQDTFAQRYGLTAARFAIGSKADRGRIALPGPTSWSLTETPRLWSAHSSPPDMPRDGAIVFSDLVGKLDLLRVSCEKCGRDGCYGLHRLIEKRGRDAKLIDWLGELTAECPRRLPAT